MPCGQEGLGSGEAHATAAKAKALQLGYQEEDGCIVGPDLYRDFGEESERS